MMNPSSHPYLGLLKTYLRPQITWVVLLAFLLLAGIGFQLLSPQIVRYFIDTVQSGGDMRLLVRAALLYIAVAVMQQVISALAAYLSENVGWKATNALRLDLTAHCLKLDISFHNAHTPGEMIERIDGDVNALSAFFSQFVIQVMGNALLMVGILALLFIESWRVGLSIGLFAVVTLAVMVRFRDIAVPHWKAERQASADLFGFLEERLAGTEDIRANGARAYVMNRFYLLMRTLLQKSLRAGLVMNILINTMWMLFALGNAAAFAVGAYLFRRQAVTIGTVYIIFQYTNMLQQPIQAITHQLEAFQRAGAGIARINELFCTHSRISDSHDISPEPGSSTPSSPHNRVGERLALSSSSGKTGDFAQALAVEFQGVSFGYHDNPPVGNKKAAQVLKSVEGSALSTEGGSGEKPEVRPEIDIVLHDLNFSLEAGTILGLLGRTGSGKTSLTRLLFRLVDPDQGVVRLGPSGALVDLRRLPLKDLRAQVGMVTQNIQLFNASVRDNLTFFDDSIPDRQLLDALEVLGLLDWLRSLPKGLDTGLESGGSGLSAGEAQLLAFTRIFLRDPGLVILDEASSRLDPATEGLIERSVDRLVKGRTAILIAHRLGTVQRAAEIMILDGGRICEYGPRLALTADPSSRYSQLLQTGLEEVLV